MDKSKILECMYEVIKESTEWGVGDKEYGMFVDGVVAMTEKILEESEFINKISNRYNVTIAEAPMTTLTNSL